MTSLQQLVLQAGTYCISFTEGDERWESVGSADLFYPFRSSRSLIKKAKWMKVPQNRACSRDVILSDFHRVTWPWRRTLKNGSDVKYIFPRCREHWVHSYQHMRAMLLFIVILAFPSPSTGLYGGRYSSLMASKNSSSVGGSRLWQMSDNTCSIVRNIWNKRRNSTPCIKLVTNSLQAEGTDWYRLCPLFSSGENKSIAFTTRR